MADGWKRCVDFFFLNFSTMRPCPCFRNFSLTSHRPFRKNSKECLVFKNASFILHKNENKLNFQDADLLLLETCIPQQVIKSPLPFLFCFRLLVKWCGLCYEVLSHDQNNVDCCYCTKTFLIF